jgi:predicted membrane channel-forming protein YqfA (hemolysin III family)
MAFYNEHLKNPTLARIVVYSIALFAILGLFYFSDFNFFTEFQSKWAMVYIVLAWNLIYIVRMIINYVKNKKQVTSNLHN